MHEIRNPATDPAATRTPSRTDRTLLGCGAVSGPLFVAAFLVEEATRAGYDPVRHPVSSLALGPSGWTQTANFLVSGLLALAFTVGLYRTLRSRGRRSVWGPLLVGAWGIGLIGAGIFVTDPVSGYPPGTPAQGVHTWHGGLHDFPFSVLTFVSLVAACGVFARRFAGWGQRGWALYSAVSGVLFAAGFVIFGAGFSQTAGLVDIAGLLQRLTIVVGWGWLTALAVHLLRTP
jgi:hypothetical protein